MVYFNFIIGYLRKTYIYMFFDSVDRIVNIINSNHIANFSSI